MAKGKAVVRVLGTLATAGGLALSLISDWVSEQKMNERIDQKVDEAFAEREKKEAEES